MSISLVGTNSTGKLSGNTIYPVGTPTGAAAGDLLVVVGQTKNNGPALSPPDSSWVTGVAFWATNPVYYPRVNTYYKELTSAPPLSYDFKAASTTAMGGFHIFVFRKTDILDAWSMSGSGRTTYSGGSGNISNNTVIVSDGYAIGIMAGTADAGSIPNAYFTSPSSPFVQIYNLVPSVLYDSVTSIGYQEYPLTGSKTVGPWTFGSGSASIPTVHAIIGVSHTPTTKVVKTLTFSWLVAAPTKVTSLLSTSWNTKSIVRAFEQINWEVNATSGLAVVSSNVIATWKVRTTFDKTEEFTWSSLLSADSELELLWSTSSKVVREWGLSWIIPDTVAAELETTWFTESYKQTIDITSKYMGWKVQSHISKDIYFNWLVGHVPVSSELDSTWMILVSMPAVKIDFIWTSEVRDIDSVPLGDLPPAIEDGAIDSTYWETEGTVEVVDNKIGLAVAPEQGKAELKSIPAYNLIDSKFIAKFEPLPSSPYQRSTGMTVLDEAGDIFRLDVTIYDEDVKVSVQGSGIEPKAVVIPRNDYMQLYWSIENFDRTLRVAHSAESQDWINVLEVSGNLDMTNLTLSFWAESSPSTTSPLNEISSPDVSVVRSNGTAVAWSPDGELLAVGAYESAQDGDPPYLLLFEKGGAGYTLQEQELPEVQPSSYVASMDWTPDGRYLAVSSLAAIMLYVRVGSTLQHLYTLNDDNLGNLSWHRNGELLLASASGVLAKLYKRTDTTLDFVYAVGSSEDGAGTGWSFDNAIVGSNSLLEMYSVSGDSPALLSAYAVIGTHYQIAVSSYESFAIIGRTDIPDPPVEPIDSPDYVPPGDPALFIYIASDQFDTTNRIYAFDGAKTGFSWDDSARFLAGISGSDLIVATRENSELTLFANVKSNWNGLSSSWAKDPLTGDLYLAATDDSSPGFSWYWFHPPSELRDPETVSAYISETNTISGGM